MLSTLYKRLAYHSEFAEQPLLEARLLVDTADVILAYPPSEPPLLEAAKDGDTKAVEELLTSAAGADVNATDKDGYTPLHWAALRGHTEIVQALLEAGADVNNSDTSELLRAAGAKNPSCCTIM